MPKQEHHALLGCPTQLFPHTGRVMLLPDLFPTEDKYEAWRIHCIPYNQRWAAPPLKPIDQHRDQQWTNYVDSRSMLVRGIGGESGPTVINYKPRLSERLVFACVDTLSDRLNKNRPFKRWWWWWWWWWCSSDPAGL